MVHKLPVYADEVNILDGSIHTVKKHTEMLLVTSTVTCPEANAEKTEYMVMSLNQNEGQNHNIQIGNNKFALNQAMKAQKRS
jgi:hypothetical protein